MGRQRFSPLSRLGRSERSSGPGVISGKTQAVRSGSSRVPTALPGNFKFCQASPGREQYRQSCPNEGAPDGGPSQDHGPTPKTHWESKSPTRSGLADHPDLGAVREPCPGIVGREDGQTQLCRKREASPVSERKAQLAGAGA